jgi:hypothetical protein
MNMKKLIPMAMLLISAMPQAIATEEAIKIPNLSQAREQLKSPDTAEFNKGKILVIATEENIKCMMDGIPLQQDIANKSQMIQALAEQIYAHYSDTTEQQSLDLIEAIEQHIHGFATIKHDTSDPTNILRVAERIFEERANMVLPSSSDEG